MKLFYNITMLIAFILSPLLKPTVVLCQNRVGGYTDYYMANGERIPVTIMDNQIGIICKRDASLDEVKRFFDTLSLSDSQLVEGSKHIYLVNTNDSLSRRGLRQLGNKLQTQRNDLIQSAGLVTYPEGATIPLITTDEIILKFSPNASSSFVEELLNSDSIRVVQQNPFVDGQYLVQVVGPMYDQLAVANQLEALSEVEFAHPNFVRVVEFRATPNDPLFGDQWHHQNTGQNSGTEDADIDSDLAWNISMGSPSTVIAIIDDGFDMTHPDLSPNFWVNPGEIPNNGIDEDGNGFIDDINGWDFLEYDNIPAAGPFDDHGTAVAGAALARGNNNIGVAGSCPTCSGLLIRMGYDVFSDALAIQYAQQTGAQIITCSWGYPIGTPATTNVVDAINNAAAAGSIIFFAMNNPNINDCGISPDISSLPSVVGVSRSTNRDYFDLSGFGNCMDLLAPSIGLTTIPSGMGTLAAVTSDRQGAEGYDPSDYTFDFGGTSFAAPLTAGVAGLMLSANPSLTPQQVQNLLQDAADKIEDSQGNYSTQTGFSTPPDGIATHGWGRVNAFEAVRIAAPVESGGLGGVDLFLRDNRLDWGNTEKPSNYLFEPTRGFIGHWETLDIKVDAPGPDYQTPPTDNASFEALIDEIPILGANNRVYVRVRNRGPVTAEEVRVKLLWAHFGTAFPSIPPDFWTSIDDPSFPTGPDTDLNIFHSVGVETISNLAYSGASVAATGTDAAQIARFDNFQGPSVSGIVHFCLMAVVDSDQDPVPDFSIFSTNLDDITPNSNNVTHRNFVVESTREAGYTDGFVIRNPYGTEARYRLEVTSEPQLPVIVEGIDQNNEITLPPFGFQEASIQVEFPQPHEEAVLTIIQRRIDGDNTYTPGGIVYRFQEPMSSPDTLITSVIECPGEVSPQCSFPVKLSVNLPSSLEADSLLGSFTARLVWDPAYLTLDLPVTYLSGFQGITNLKADVGELIFNGTNTEGAGGLVDILEANFTATGEIGSSGSVNLSFTALAAANTFANLLTDGAADSECSFTILGAAMLGDVNGDTLVNSTDALAVLSYDVGLEVPEAISEHIAQGWGDINLDALTNSTDALIILTYDAGLPVGFPIGEVTCPQSANSQTVAARLVDDKMATGPISVVMDLISDQQGNLQLPVHLDGSKLEQPVGSYSATIKWNPDVMEFISLENGSSKQGQFIVNEKQASEGLIKIAYANPGGLPDISNLFTLIFREKGLVMINDVDLNFNAVNTIDFRDVNALMNVTRSFEKIPLGKEPLSINPNPIDGATQISYSIEKESLVHIRIYNSNGELVKLLVNEVQAAGSYVIQWEGKASNGAGVDPGIYLLSLESQYDTQVIRAIIK